jgi:hypothetical protein
MTYLGIMPLNGEDLPYPCFKGCLQYKHEGKLRPYAFRDSERLDKHKRVIKYEQVNPVMVWVINDYIISLCKPDPDGPPYDGLHINKSWKSITDRLNHEFNKNDYDIPDYYLYTIREDENDV